MPHDATSLTHAQRRRSLIFVAFFAAFVVYLTLTSYDAGFAVVGCPFRGLTGYSCFGCGMTRACAHALRGEFGHSLHFHPMGIFVTAGFAVAAAHHAARWYHGRVLDYGALRFWRRIEKPVWVAIALFTGVFGIVRFVLELRGILTPI